MRIKRGVTRRARSRRSEERGARSEERVRAGSGRLCGTSRRCETSSRLQRRGMGPVDRVRESGYDDGLRRLSTTEAWTSSGTGTSRPSRRFSVSFLPSFPFLSSRFSRKRRVASRPARAVSFYFSRSLARSRARRVASVCTIEATATATVTALSRLSRFRACRVTVLDPSKRGSLVTVDADQKRRDDSYGMSRI